MKQRQLSVQEVEYIVFHSKRVTNVDGNTRTIEHKIKGKNSRVVVEFHRKYIKIITVI